MAINVLSNLQTSITPTTDSDIVRKAYVDTLVNNKTLSALTNGHNASIESLSADTYLMTQNRIMAEFSTAQQYNPDDYVTYQGKVYKCITLHPAGVWNASHFVLTTLDAYIQNHLHSAHKLSDIQDELSESIANDYPYDVPTCQAVYYFVEGMIPYNNKVFSIMKTLSSSTVTLEDDYTIYKYTVSANTTFTFATSSLSSVGTGFVITFELYIVMPSTAYTITFPNSVSWLNNEVPSMSTPNKTYMFVFRSLDGGTTWLGSKEGAY